MRQLSIHEPVSDSEFDSLKQVRVLSSVAAYSTSEGPDSEQIRSKYDGYSKTIITKIKTGDFISRIATLDKIVVGMCVWSPGKTTAKIEYLYIHPHYQNRGYGSMLLGAAISELLGKTIELTTQNAKDFYAKWGFQTTNKFVSDGITSEEIMIRPIV